MPPETIRLSRSTLIVMASLLALLTACGGGVRPTLTGDRLVEPSEAAAPGLAQPTAPASVDQAGIATDQSGGDDATYAPADPVQTIPEPETLPPGVIEDLVVQVLDSFPHDPAAWTQGLELDNGTFIESTGLEGESDLRRVDPATGEVIQLVNTPNNFFAEGTTRVGDEIIQITWTNNTAFYWDANSFELKKEVFYPGEGWGLCYDGSRLVMSDGSSQLIFRDPTTFGEVGRTTVTYNGQEVFSLNELECVNGSVWANIWQTDLIVRINPMTGEVNGLVDATALVGPDDDKAVLNGIAWDESTQSFYLTGKFWPTMYRVTFLPAAQ